MNKEEKEQFIKNLNYFWFEKGHTGFSEFTNDKLDEVDSQLADAYFAMENSKLVFESLLKAKAEEL